MAESLILLVFLASGFLLLFVIISLVMLARVARDQQSGFESLQRELRLLRLSLPPPPTEHPAAPAPEPPPPPAPPPARVTAPPPLPATRAPEPVLAMSSTQPAEPRPRAEPS